MTLNCFTVFATLVTLQSAWAPPAQQAYLKASNNSASSEFGISVAVSGDTMVVGAIEEAYIFVRSGTNWSQQAILKASNIGGPSPREVVGDLFGVSVAVSGDTVVVGAFREDSSSTGVNGDQNDNSTLDSGAAYVFVRSGTNWSQQAYLKASNTGADDWFGFSVAVAGDTVVVGAHQEDSNATGVNGDQNDNSAERAGAAYVFVRSGTNWSQQAYLKASNTEANDVFGVSVAVSGDTVVIGASLEDSNASEVNSDQSDNSAQYVGAAYVFVRSGTNWSQQAYLKASNTGAEDFFGGSVAISGDTVVVGALRENSSTTGVNGDQSDNSAEYAGAAYVFVRNGTSWSQQAYLKASNTGPGDGFGNAVAISGDAVVIGASGEDSNATGVNGTGSDPMPYFDSGAAYIFVRSGTNWNQQAYLKASNADWYDAFGSSVAVSGDTVVVGAYAENSNATEVNGNQCDNSASDSGAAYIFDLNATTITMSAPEIAVEQPPGTDLSDGSATVDFGNVGLGGNSQRTFTIRNTGSADLTGLGITITGPNADDFTVAANPSASLSASACGSTAFPVNFFPGAEGVRTADLHIASNDGDESSFDITLTGTGILPLPINQQAYLKASNNSANSEFGISVAVSGDTMVVGAIEQAYIFVRRGTKWIQQACLKGSNTGAGDFFGYCVAVSGDTVVIGAPWEDSSTTGVNGDQSDNSALDSGAAYVFVRNGTNWSQQAYLKASNTDASDNFGSSVSVSGDTVVVGAFGEASGTTGVNGDQSDNGSNEAGAAYVFVRDAFGQWSQQAYLKASNTDAGDQFGFSVAVAGDTVAVGARYESNREGNSQDIYGGAAYVFVRSGTDWSQQAYLKASFIGAYAYFGSSVAVAGDTLVVGSPGRGGAAYVFVRSGTDWSQETYLGPPIFRYYYFGAAVAVSGDTVVVGAPGEDSNGEAAGAAYVFVRSSATWSQEAFLKASNTEAYDNFGSSVAVSGDTVVVGAYAEDSNATGVNGAQRDNSAPNAGAAYIFTGPGLRRGPRLVIVPELFGGFFAGGYFLRFAGHAGYTYQLQRASSLTGPWHTIDTQTTPPSGLIEFDDSWLPLGSSFYRAVQP